MELKQINFLVKIKDPKDNTRDFPIQRAYTNDLNSVKLTFELTDTTAAELTGATASILFYMLDRSFFQDTATVTGNKVEYTLTEAQGNHAGPVQVQIMVTVGGVTYASAKRKFDIIAGLETQVATEVMIKDWTMLTAEARAYLDEFAANEVTRQQTAATAESARAQTFTTNEAGRQSTFAANEATRETNETVRKAAEAARAVTFGQWSDTQADWAAAEAARVNDFSSKADKTYTDTELSKKADKSTTYTKTEVDTKDGLLVPKTTTVNTKALTGNISIAAVDVPNTPAGGIAATNVQAALNELDTEKANKAQEAWTTPTLLNGWVGNHIGLYGNLRYRKNQFGNVEIVGSISGGANNSIVFVLPAGYRPSHFKGVVTKSVGTSVASFEIETNGNVKILNFTTNVQFDFSFPVN